MFTCIQSCKTNADVKGQNAHGSAKFQNIQNYTYYWYNRSLFYPLTYFKNKKIIENEKPYYY